MKRVLVTGATGFLGKYIVQELNDYNYDVIAFGRNEENGKKLVSGKTKFIKGDFTKFDQINTASKNVDAIIHAGALSTIWGKWDDFYNCNVIGTKNVINSCLNNGVKKLIYVSSPSIYTSNFDRFNIKEEEFDSNNSINFYVKTKILSENLVSDVDKSKLYTNIIRPRGIIGIGDTSIVPRIIKLNNKIGIPLVNGGENVVDLTSVENVALSLRLCLEKNQFNGHIYNITNDEPSQFKKLIDLALYDFNIKPKYINMNYSFLYNMGSLLEKLFSFFNIYKIEPPITRYTSCVLGKSQTLCVDRAKKELLYRPKISLKESFRKYAKYYKYKTH